VCECVCRKEGEGVGVPLLGSYTGPHHQITPAGCHTGSNDLRGVQKSMHNECVCVCVCVCACVCVCVCECVCVCVCVCVCACVCMCVCVVILAATACITCKKTYRVRVCVRVCMCVQLCENVCICKCMCVCVCACLYDLHHQIMLVRRFAGKQH